MPRQADIGELRPVQPRHLVPPTPLLFVRVGGLDDAAFIEEVADDLEADGEAFAEATGHAYRGQPLFV
jgi:hypothetical protein